jgi:hypothetical protein
MVGSSRLELPTSSVSRKCSSIEQVQIRVSNWFYVKRIGHLLGTRTSFGRLWARSLGAFGLRVLLALRIVCDDNSLDW